MSNSAVQVDSTWAALVEGIGCPFCAPRQNDSVFWIMIQRLGVSTLYLHRNQTYRGQSILVFDSRHAVGLENLSSSEFNALSNDLRLAARAVADVCQPDLMNYASMGNVIPHLHWHLVPRYKADPRWGGPIYASTREEMREVHLADEDYASIVAAIRSRLLTEE